jgi:hypothetical protein
MLSQGHMVALLYRYTGREDWFSQKKGSDVELAQISKYYLKLT